MTVIRYRETLLNRYRDRRLKTSLQQDHNHPSQLDTTQLKNAYCRIDRILQEKQKTKRNYRSRLKYHNPLLDVKQPFIDKSKLVR